MPRSLSLEPKSFHPFKIRLARELQEPAATPAHGRLNAVICPETVNINVKTKIRYNGQEFADQNQMPKDVRRLCDDVMSVIENNGEVTLPSGRPSEPLFGKRQRQFVLLVVGALIFAGLLVLAKAIN